MYKFDITGGIVLYKNDRKILEKAINSFLNTSLNVRLYLIDNSPTDDLKNISSSEKVIYIHNPANPGFGAGHNVAINEVKHLSKYHLILNPDIFYDKGVLENIIQYMDTNSDIGVLMPKVLYPNGEIQYLAKLLPTPFDFIVRRFIPFKKYREKINNRFELRNSKYEKIMEVPFLSGCFLVFRTDVMEKIGGFDEKIFMYTEDIDICRSVIKAGYKSVFYPLVTIYHDHEKKSFLNIKTLKVYLKSAVYYFNKWGWVFDKERKSINYKTLNQF